MMRDFRLPPTGFGPGTQGSEEDDGLEFMAMPEDMRTYVPRVPEMEDAGDVSAALALIEEIAKAADAVGGGAENITFDLSGLDAANRSLIAETMGEGEVAMKLFGRPALRVQESVFAGVWMITGSGIDRIEVGAVPALARSRAFDALTVPSGVEPGAGVVNAPAMLTELAEKSASYEGELHVINLTLLPHTEADLVWLDERLGQGSTDILSRGYGNCRVRATALPHVWRVQFFNSMDTLILDTFEVTEIPEVASAADEDLADSARRLRSVLEAIQ